MFTKALAQILAALLLLTCLSSIALAEAEAWPETDDAEWPDETEAFEEDDEPLEEDIVAWYDAMDVYDMFVNCPLDIDYDQPNSDGTMYLVVDERFTSLQALTDFARSFFAEDIAQNLLGAGMYQEEDGRLFARDTVNYASDNIDDIQIDLDIKDDRIDYTVTVTYLSPNAANETEKVFHFTRASDGDEWRFTEFPAIG
jgi:hypothetical protein